MNRSLGLRVIVLSVAAATLTAAASALAGCTECEGNACNELRRGARGNGDEAGENGEAGSTWGSVPEGQTCSDDARDTVGLGGVALKSGRPEGIAGADRRRTKPFAMLSGELARVLGKTPASMAGMAATFGEDAARWYAEPEPTAVSLASTLSVAFDGCLEVTATDAAYEATPDASTATAACTAFARKFWSRVVTPEEVQGCVDVAVTDSENETFATGADGAPVTKPTTARRRWAYACASLLTSSPFLAY